MTTYYLIIFAFLFLTIGLLKLLKKYKSTYKFMLGIISALCFVRILNFGLTNIFYPFLETIIVAIFIEKIIDNT